MYLPHYGLNEKPFAPSPDPRYLWFGDRQLGLYASLEAAVLQGGGTIVLTGDVGTGKTTFLKSLEAGLRQKTVFANISDPALNEPDFYRLVAHGLGMDRIFNSRNEFIGYMRAVARKSAKMRKRIIVAVDESQRIESGLMKKIWFLANVEPELASEVTWIFVGQDELLEHFKSDGIGLFNGNHVDHFQMHPLDKSETGAYIHFRMKRAGSQKKGFSEKAIDRIYCHTAGHPRLINSICDLALLYGFTEEIYNIDSKIVDACAGKICLPHQPDGKDGNKAKLKSELKATVWLFASLLCLTMSGVLTYRWNYSENRIQHARPRRASVQSLLPVGEVQASLSNANLQSLSASTFFKIDPLPDKPAERRHQQPQSEDISLWDITSETHGVVSENKAQYGAINDAQGEREGIPGKPAVVPQKAAGRADDGNVSIEKSAPAGHGVVTDKEPDPSEIIDWLLEK